MASPAHAPTPILTDESARAYTEAQQRSRWRRTRARLEAAGVPDAADWMPRAACASGNAADWYADGDTRGGAAAQARARAVCGACPVQRACLDTALARPEDHGIWGGLTANERRRVRPRKQPA